ncbi:MAG TPA: sigma-70 family RNA polymerase sigma factor [Anaerolineales bacterium]|nr:sigma-70 family RNA polymerase sigma factor [Anaerolineales bacterium]
MGEGTERSASDSDLISLAQSGDADAFGELYLRYVNPIYRYIRMRVGDAHAAEDLTEMVFLRSFESLPGYRERGHPFSAFLYRVARNMLVDHYRSKKAEVPLEEADLKEGEPAALEEGVIRKDRDQAILEALASLPLDYQEVIRLRVAMALPTPSVAEWMGRSEVSVRVLLHRALKALRKKVEEVDQE